MLIAMFMLATMALPASSQTVGVAVGDWFDYSISATQTTNSTGTAYVPNIIGTMALSSITYNLILQTPYVSVKRTVTAVSGTAVNFTEEWTDGAGSVTTLENVMVNATSGNMYWALIPANLEADDTVYSSPTYVYPQTNATFYINATESKTYPSSVSRDVCTMAWNYDHGNARAYFNASYSWDQTTGILVDSNLTTYFMDTSGTGRTTTIFLFNLGASSKWDVPEFPTATVMLLMFVAVAVSIDIFRRKKLV